jgi:hypothetical protein
MGRPHTGRTRRPRLVRARSVARRRKHVAEDGSESFAYRWCESSGKRHLLSANAVRLMCQMGYENSLLSVQTVHRRESFLHITALHRSFGSDNAGHTRNWHDFPVSSRNPCIPYRPFRVQTFFDHFGPSDFRPGDGRAHCDHPAGGSGVSPVGPGRHPVNRRLAQRRSEKPLVLRVAASTRLW